jgi:hypothetical protein
MNFRQAFEEVMRCYGPAFKKLAEYDQKQDTDTDSDAVGPIR